MNVSQAMKLTPGARVRFPEDRGTPAGDGRVVSVGDTVHKAHNGAEYVWVEVYMYTQQHAALWPSNRLAS